MSNHFFGENEGDLWQEYGNPSTPWERKVEILVNLASIEAHKENWSKEIKLLENAADLATQHGLKLESYRINNIIAIRQLRIFGDAEEAIRRAQLVLDAEPNFVADEEVLRFIVQAYCRKGSALIYLKRYPEAIHIFKIVADYADMLGDGPEVAHANVSLMRAFIDLGDIERAKQAGTVAKDLYQDNSRIVELLEVDRLFAKIAILEENFVRAKIDLKEVRVLEQRLHQRSDVETKILLGRAYIGLEQYPAAERVLRRAYESSVTGWNMDFPNSLEAGFYLVQCLEAQGNSDEAARIAAECKALAKRSPGVKNLDLEDQHEVVADLLHAGKPDESVAASDEFINMANEQGNIRARWIALTQKMRGLWLKDDFPGITAIWDEVAKDSLNYQDDLVIPVKNMVTHALQKEGRINEALTLNKEVLADIRVQDVRLEFLYAKENAARINKELENYREARKLKDEVVKEYLELGCPDRALGLIEYMDKRKKRGPGK